MSGRFWLTHLALPVLVAALLGLFLGASGLDEAACDLYFDPATRTFPLRWSYLHERVLHRGVSDVLVVLGAGLLGLAALGPMSWRRAALLVTLSMAFSTASVAGLKLIVNRHCPWDLERYGGQVPDALARGPLFQIEGHKPCFPCGHSAGWFSFLSLYFVFRQNDRLRAALGLFVSTAVGLATGWVQVMRGAHFPSHVVWTAIVSWLVCLAVFSLGGDEP